MPQLLLPIVSPGETQINSTIRVWKHENVWTYFLGSFPIYSHKEDNHRMFRFVIAQLIESGACKQTEIIKSLGVTKSRVNRAQRKLRQGGIDAFFENNQGHRRAGTIFTPDVLIQAQNFLDQGMSKHEVAEELGIKYDTFRKAINDGRLKESESIDHVTPTDKSTRTVIDAEAADGMGTACTRVDERASASFGICDGAPIRFESCLDVPKGGVLCALPALLSNGLLNDVEKHLGDINGYYTNFHILLLLAFMALCRIKTVEQLRGVAPGEFGKLLGLDRIPEVRCLREKIDDLSVGDTTERWAAHLSKYWMDMHPDWAGTLYIDGHVRLYHGKLTKLPRRFVSRERLCLRGTTDYWVNDAIGRPFFYVEKVVDSGLLKALQDNIVPRLLKDIPNQPTEQQLCDNPNLCRFIMVFDREGYSPAFFKKMWQEHRISCMTYHKYPDENWSEDLFVKHDVTLSNGETVTMKIAEKTSLVGSGKNAMRMREIRKLTESGHQTSIISTVYEYLATDIAARMFTRWCQENFFRYMMKHFAIDLLQEYGVDELPDTELVVNPAWRILDRARNSLQNKLRYRHSRFAQMILDFKPKIKVDTVKYDKWVAKKSLLLEEIEKYKSDIEKTKKNLKNTPKHIEWKELKKEDQFFSLPPGRKRLMDTIKMISYRGETAMANLLKNSTENVDIPAARQLLQDLYVMEANILPQPEDKLLHIQIHNASRPAVNKLLEVLFTELNATEINYPGTDMRMTYSLIGKKN